MFVHSHSHHGRWRGQWSMNSREGDEEGVLGYTRVYSLLTSMHANNEYARYTLRSNEYTRAYSLPACILTHNVYACVSPN